MFYDLNLQVDGLGDLARREVVAMAMQLGYSGVAANHLVTGTMGDTDRCRIRPLELQMILATAPGVLETARFHKKILGVPHGEPFRQFSRITVFVDTPTQANSVNLGNPVLKSYDLVAVRPTNQKMFNLACSQLEVDLISLDFTQRLPIRFKPAVVKAAVERGIYFEICYGRALLDPKARRELFINSMNLQEAASGRNIVVCSGARRAAEMRGPNDVANMSTLFGFSLESAKNCVSRICKSLILHGVVRKTYKAAVHVERVDLESKPTGEAFDVPKEWDPLSLGGASVDFIPETETCKKLVSSNKSTTDLEEIKLAFSELEGVDDKFSEQSLNILAMETSKPIMPVSKIISTDSAATRPKGNKKRRGNTVLSDNGEEGQQKCKAKRRKKKK